MGKIPQENEMKIFISQNGQVVQVEDSDAIDVITKRYSVRIRISGARIIRNARPKKDLPAKVIYDEHLNLT